MTVGKSATLAIFFVVFSLQPAKSAGGVLLYTRDGSSYVAAIEYDTFVASPAAHAAYATVNGKRVQIQSSNIIVHIPFPDTSGNASQKDAENFIGMTEVFTTRYPQYARILKGAGEQWRRRAAQPPPTAVVIQPPNFQDTLISEGLESRIPVIRTKTGQIFKNVKITRFEDDKASISHDGGIGRITITDIADISSLPPDVRGAVEKVQMAFEAKKKAEADRIAAEERRIAEEKRVAEKRRIAEEKRVAEKRRIAEEQRIAEDESVASASSVEGKNINGQVGSTALNENEQTEKNFSMNEADLEKAISDNFRRATSLRGGSTKLVRHKDIVVKGYYLSMSFEHLYANTVQQFGKDKIKNAVVGQFSNKYMNMNGKYMRIHLKMGGMVEARINNANPQELEYLGIDRIASIILFNAENATEDIFMQGFDTNIFTRVDIDKIKKHKIKDRFFEYYQYASSDGWMLFIGYGYSGFPSITIKRVKAAHELNFN